MFNDKIKELKKEIYYKWKIQTAKENVIVCVAYIDSRDAQDLLDDVVGEMNWVNNFRRDEKGNLVCAVSIYDSEKQIWVTKEDVGTESPTEKEKGEYSDAFKRACVHWGIGRFLYHVPNFIFYKDKIKMVNGKPKPIDDKGKPIFNGNDLTAYIQGKSKTVNVYSEIDKQIKLFYSEIMLCSEINDSIKEEISKDIYANVAYIFNKKSWKEIQLSWLKTSRKLLKEKSTRILDKIEEVFTDLEDLYKEFRHKIYKSSLDKEIKDELKNDEFKDYLSKKLFNNDKDILKKLQLDESVKEKITDIYNQYK